MRFSSFFVSLLFLFSCGEQQSSSHFIKPSGEKSDVNIKLAVFPNIDVAYKELILEFEKENPNIKVELQVLGFRDHHNMIMDNLAKGKDLPDVIAVEANYIDLLVSAFQNLCEQPYNASELKKDFFPYKWAQASLRENVLLAMPFDIAPACAWYRIDVFERRGVDINKIEDIEDLYRAGNDLTFDEDLDGKIDHWLLPNARLIFDMIFFSFKQRYYQDGEINLKSSAVVKAMQWAKEFRKAGYDANVEEWTKRWYDGLNKGKFAYVISGPWLGWHLNNWIAPNAKNKFRVAKLPKLSKKDKKRMNFDKGGSFLAIPRKAGVKNKEAAWQLIKWLVARKESQIFTYEKADALPAYLPAWDDKIFEEGIEYIGGQKVKHLWKQMALNIPEVYVNVNDFYARRYLYEALYEVLEKEYDIDIALESAQNRLMKKIK